MASVLSDELTNDPLGRGYSGMTDAEAAADLNTEYRTRNLSSLSGDRTFQQTNPTEYSNLSADNKQLWVSFCGRETIDPFATANVEFVKSVFGDSSTTVSNLASARTESISRAGELGLPRVRTGDVERAR